MTSPFPVIVQASPEEILKASEPNDLNLHELQKSSVVSEFLVVLPKIEGYEAAERRLRFWGISSYTGDSFNVCRRILESTGRWPENEFSVRVLAIWKHLDFELIAGMVDAMRGSDLDMVTIPRDFELTVAADVASHKALKHISAFKGKAQEYSRARFNPWGYMDKHNDCFRVFYYEPAPSYPCDKIEMILADSRCHPENEYVGRAYMGSRYHKVSGFVPDGARVLDIACGAGHGSYLMAQKASFVLGCDYLDEYVKTARKRYGETESLRFMQADGQTFIKGDGGEFDVVVSLHTLEHVPDDAMMLYSLRENLMPGGLLIVEVPLCNNRPFGKPINPFHLREYNKQLFVEKVKVAGFKIERLLGVNRGFYCDSGQARDAILILASKLN